MIQATVIPRLTNNISIDEIRNRNWIHHDQIHIDDCDNCCLRWLWHLLSCLVCTVDYGEVKSNHDTEMKNECWVHNPKKSENSSKTQESTFCVTQKNILLYKGGTTIRSILQFLRGIVYCYGVPKEFLLFSPFSPGSRTLPAHHLDLGII